MVERMERKHIAIIGCGVVGLSTGKLLEISNDVLYVDSNDKIVSELNSQEKKAVLSTLADYENVDIAFICVPTKYDEFTGLLDTSIVDRVIENISLQNKDCIIVIKSTVPIGYTKKHNNKNILYCPEFLREKYASYDSMYPSRIIIGHNNDELAIMLAELLKDSIYSSNINILFTGYGEAEAIKLYSNAYLATRIAFFNEIDTYSKQNGLDIDKIMRGICLDNRIGDYYNKISSGFDGKCLPKDIKCLKTQTGSSLLENVIKSNENRKKYCKNA